MAAVADACKSVWSQHVEKSDTKVRDLPRLSFQLRSQSTQLNAPVARIDVVSCANGSACTGILVTCEHAFCDGRSISHVSASAMILRLSFTPLSHPPPLIAVVPQPPSQAIRPHFTRVPSPSPPHLASIFRECSERQSP